MLIVDYAWEINELHTDQADSLLQVAVGLARQLQFSKGEAAALNSLGVVQEIRGNYTKAIDFYKQALAIRRRLGDLSEIGATLNNLGIAYDYQGNFDSAFTVYRENLGIQQELRDTQKIARAHYNIAGAQQEMGLYLEAQDALMNARSVFLASKNREGTAKVYIQLGHLSFEMERYDTALVWYKRALKLHKQLDDPGRYAKTLTDIGNALDELNMPDSALIYYKQALDIWKGLEDLLGQAQVYTNMGDAYKHINDYVQALRYLQIAEEICLSLNNEQILMEVYNVMGDVHGRANRLNLALEYTQIYYKIAQEAGDEKYIQSAYKDFAEVYAQMGDFKKAYHWRVLYDELRYKRMNLRVGVAFNRREELFADEKKKEEIERQRQELRVRDAELASAQTRQLALLGGAVALLLLAALLYNRNRIRTRANRELAAKNDAIQRERERADKLLKNILPEKTAEELKRHNSVQPVRYESVTVMFTDFKGFTQIAERVTPEELIQSLDECFRLFDSIIEKYGLEKIKTLGDAYMCAGGVPTANNTHPLDTVNAAFDMLHELAALSRRRAAEGKPVFEMRIGIHTGPVVAGVVGSHKFAYDIWGDTVNTAARLEQGGEPGKINISETTYQRVRHVFNCTFRGKLAAKNKGEIEMYFVEGRI